MDAISGDVEQKSRKMSTKAIIIMEMKVMQISIYLLIVNKEINKTLKRFSVLVGTNSKDLRGIKKHQRSCRVIRGLDKELLSELQNISDFENQPDLDHHVVKSEENPMFKTGVKLPKSDKQCNLANS